MESTRFDDLARSLSASHSRRSTIAGLAGGALGLVLAGLGLEDALAACVALNRKCGKGKKCCAGTLCKSGKCRCKAGSTACAGRCVNTDTDPDNCGGCGTPCGPDQSCDDGRCVVPPRTCPVDASKGEQLDACRRMETRATLNCDGRLVVETFSQNCHAFEALRGRLRVVAFDAAGNTWTSPLFACTTRVATTDPCQIFGGCTTSGTDRFTAQAPADFAQRATRLEIFHAHNLDPLP